jgi:hypothetical protein
MYGVLCMHGGQVVSFEARHERAAARGLLEHYLTQEKAKGSEVDEMEVAETRVFTVTKLSGVQFTYSMWSGVQ